LSDAFISAIRLAAPLHDIGKVVIPENLLHKPGMLDENEWETMKGHADAGFQLLSKSKTSVSKLGARLAHYHHENWDGSGYPDGLVGQEIPLEARIMAIADVFDSLGSTRCYKEKWCDGDIKTFLIEQRNIKFDAKMIDVFVEHYDQFCQIRIDHPDS